MLTLKSVAGGYDDKQVIQDMNFSVFPGEFFGILGPNGSGKTTLLKLISGLLPCSDGSIQLDNQDLQQFSTKALARKMAVLPQLTSHAFPYTVRDTVALGRYAHLQGVFQTWTAEDERVVETVMEQTHITGFQHHLLQELSGGEQQRVFLAQALAQEPAVLLLDEPTNHLDLAYQKDLLDLLKRMVREQHLTVVAIFHDVNLASLYGDRLLLMHGGQVKALGRPDGVLTESVVNDVYQTGVKKNPHPSMAKPQMHLIPSDYPSVTKGFRLDASMLDVQPERVTFISPAPLRTFASHGWGSGIGWNRYVVQWFDATCSADIETMGDYLARDGFDPAQTIGMVTAGSIDNTVYYFGENEAASLLTVVTVGQEGTISVWLFINGIMTDEAFMQAMMTAAEAKTQTLRELGVTRTPSIGPYPEDRIVVAALQYGPNLPGAGMTIDLGQLIHDCVCKALWKRMQSNDD
ncbi:ATP-binding cassette domain-containing protein [Lentibacillus halophilus]|uniref:ATP-binding cassette domain-containing protein n=1 Tax=Lentibacillus halophilus TaxID=295065 RepID=A0ABN0ZHJ6_9BACI